jgi:hypothetical protein
MNTILDIGSELLIDRSSIRDPYLRLIADAMGRAIANGSAWVTVQKADLKAPAVLSNGAQANLTSQEVESNGKQFI